MRILLALDGSAGAEIARDLVAALPWPAPTVVSAVRVIEPIYDVFGMPPLEVDPGGAIVPGFDAVRSALVAEIEDLEREGLSVEPHVLVGRAATSLLDAATDMDALVIGSRGRGPMASMVLGSVSAEVVGHARCPVIVARRPSMERVMIAIDGSDMTEPLVDAVLALGCFTGRRLEVVAVAPSPVPPPSIMLTGGYGMSVAWYEEGVAIAREAMASAAEGVAGRFEAAGYEVSWSVPEGDPASTLVDHAASSGADAIVVGTHGRTGLDRLLMGSVARNVLLHARTSVAVIPRR
ncbi:MAG: universal stress protein [Candidatus Limnocylindria bacterium]